MNMDLSGRVALITGGSRGIGRAMAEAFAAAGARVVISSRRQEALDEVAEATPGDVTGIAAHAGDPEAVSQCVERVVADFGGVDILVNNAATNPYFGSTIDIDLPRHDKTWEVNFRGPLVWIQQAHERSMGERGGVVLNVASIGGLSIEPAIGIYNTTKAALIHLTKTLAAELGPGVRVNAIAPGLVKTDFARALWEENEGAMAARLPLGRLGEPEDIAGAALFCVSDVSSWMTGHTLVVDGGALVASS